jgi:hypothetical protein
MIDSLYPRIPYEDVQSVFIRQQIFRNSFYEIEHRQFVNSLIHTEWFARNGYPENCSGLSASSIEYKDALVALKYPDAYDQVRSEFGKSTRAERMIRQDRDEDPQMRRAWAQRHRDEWQAVANDEECTQESVVGDVSVEDRGEFNRFRFPVIPYTSVESTFTRDEIRTGSFDDYEYRQYVNRLVFVERWLRKGLQAAKTAYYQPVGAYQVAGMVPDGFRILRIEFDREEIPPFGPQQQERDEQDEQRFRDSWQAVSATNG